MGLTKASTGLFLGWAARHAKSDFLSIAYYRVSAQAVALRSAYEGIDDDQEGRQRSPQQSRSPRSGLLVSSQLFQQRLGCLQVGGIKPPLCQDSCRLKEGEMGGGNGGVSVEGKKWGGMRAGRGPALWWGWGGKGRPRGW